MYPEPTLSAAPTSLPHARRVLIYRLGSLGDTVIALPCFHLIERTFPDAERALLTNIPINARAPAAAAVLGLPPENASGLVHRYFEYPVATRSLLRLGALAVTIRRYAPDVLIYLAAPRGDAAIQRDARFFRLCGIRHIFGLPAGDLGTNQLAPTTGLLEAESHRLARTLAPLGNARLEDAASWDLRLTSSEKTGAVASTLPLGNTPYIVCAPGCKAPANDWEDANWATLFQKLSIHLSSQPEAIPALVLTGAESDRARNDRLRQAWRGPSLNLCGNSPREAAALLARAILYLGPDSGPMHIAAAVGTPSVSIFSARLGLGIWFPHGPRSSSNASVDAAWHRILYNRTSCSPCHLETCTVEGKRCILSISPDQVLEAALGVLQGGRQ